MAGLKGRFRPVHILLLIPYAFLLWVPSYNTVEPSLWGVPFFYWYLLAWIPLGALLLIPVYLHEEKRKNGSR
jgi:hypothetical protein